MKKYFALAAMLITVSASAQTVENKKEEVQNQSPKAVSKPSSGDYFDGFSKTITWDRMIPPYGLEVTFDKTCHVIFPTSITYVDLGSASIIGGRAGDAKNVLRVKAAVRGFESETNMAVITEDGCFFSFNVKYADEPEKLNTEMKDFIHDGEAVNRPNNSLEIYLKELGNESPKMVYLTNKSIYKQDKRSIRHIGSNRFGIQFLAKGIYSQNDLLYLHFQIKNSTSVPFDVDFMRMKIVDKKLAKRTAIQETVIYPIRAFNNVLTVKGRSVERTVFTIHKITIPDDKQLVVELFEKNGGRHQAFVISNEDLVRAKEVNDLKIE